MNTVDAGIFLTGEQANDARNASQDSNTGNGCYSQCQHKFDSCRIRFPIFVLLASMFMISFCILFSFKPDKLGEEIHHHSKISNRDAMRRAFVGQLNPVGQLHCCLDNMIMYTASLLNKGCKMAMPTDVVILPMTLSEHGVFRTKLPIIANVDDLIETAKQRGCTLITLENAKERNFTLINYGSSLKDGDHGVYTRWFYKTVMFPDTLIIARKECYGELYSKKYHAIHLRIEQDWYPHYCAMRSRRGKVQACYSPIEIANSLVGILSRDSPMLLLLLYGKPAKEFTNAIDVFKSVFPKATVFHKSQAGVACQDALSKLFFNERAFLDFWMALQAHNFVGTQMSSFSNGVTQSRWLKRVPGSSWSYSCPHIAPLVLRKDHGERHVEGQKTRGQDTKWCEAHKP